jgi:arginyl-tRNA synthetase
MWYEAAFERTGQHKVLDELMDRQQQKDPAVLGQVVREIAAHHQRFIDDDPDGTKYFLPFLRENKLTLAELGRAYAFVTAVTDHPEAQTVRVKHPKYDERTLADLPRLVTTFIQNPAEHEQERLAWEKARDVTLEAGYDVYRQLNVQLADPSIQTEPLERGESFYNPMLPDIVKTLREKGLAVDSDGAVVVQVPGYESPLIIQKADGGYLYGTTDLAAVRFRSESLAATRLLYFVDARQSQHFQQVFWTAKQAGWMGHATAEHAAFGTILGEDGKPFKARSGETVKLKELLDEAEERAAKIVAEKATDLSDAQRKSVAHAVGIGAVKYFDMSKDRTSDYVFDWNKMLSFDGNTAPYLQNAYVRVHGIFRKARASGIDPTPRYETLKLGAPQELALAKHMLRISDVIDAVARELKPHLLTNYLFELATLYHAFFEHCPVLQSEESVRSSRLALSALVARTLALGLDLIGIEHPEQM